MHEKLGDLVVWRRFSGVAAYFQEAIDEVLQERKGISLSELQLLISLRRVGGSARMSDLAQTSRITKAGMTKMVTRLEEERLVSRSTSAQDRRVRNVRLTPRGAHLLKATRPVLVKWLHRHFLSAFNRRELEALNEAMLRLVESNGIPDPADRD